MNFSSVPVSIIWSRMDQDVDSTFLSVDVEKVSIPQLERSALNISPSDHNGESFSSPVFGWYFNFENITEFDWLISALSIVCTVFAPSISNFIVDVACWCWATCWNLKNSVRITLAIMRQKYVNGTYIFAVGIK